MLAPWLAPRPAAATRPAAADTSPCFLSLFRARPDYQGRECVGFDRAFPAAGVCLGAGRGGEGGPLTGGSGRVFLVCLDVRKSCYASCLARAALVVDVLSQLCGGSLAYRNEVCI